MEHDRDTDKHNGMGGDRDMDGVLLGWDTTGVLTRNIL